MDALEQWERLNKTINITYYIGPDARKCIEDALVKSEKVVKPIVQTITIDKSKLGKKA